MALPDPTHGTRYNFKLSAAIGLPGGVKQYCLRIVTLALITLALAGNLRADTISGTVKDPSGAVVADARIEISGSNIPQPITSAFR